MTQKFMCILAVVIMGICLISGGCSSHVMDNVQNLKEIIKLSPPEKENEQKGIRVEDLLSEETPVAENIEVVMYFADAEGKHLMTEERNVPKVEGIARKTVEMLLKGPRLESHSSAFPSSTRLMDINIKADGTCIVDLSSEVRTVKSEQEEKLLVYSIINTLAFFPSVERVSFMIEGEEVNTIGGYMDLSSPLEPDFNI